MFELVRCALNTNMKRVAFERGVLSCRSPIAEAPGPSRQSGRMKNSGCFEQQTSPSGEKMHQTVLLSAGSDILRRTESDGGGGGGVGEEDAAEEGEGGGGGGAWAA
jgi:hypothetical protein